MYIYIYKRGYSGRDSCMLHCIIYDPVAWQKPSQHHHAYKLWISSCAIIRLKHSFFFFFIYLLSRLSTCNGRRCDTIRLDFIEQKKIFFSLSVERFRDLFPRQNSRWNVVTGRETCSKEAVCSNAIFFFSKRKCYTFQRPRVC